MTQTEAGPKTNKYEIALSDPYSKVFGYLALDMACNEPEKFKQLKALLRNKDGMVESIGLVARTWEAKNKVYRELSEAEREILTPSELIERTVEELQMSNDLDAKKDIARHLAAGELLMQRLDPTRKANS